MFVGALLLMVAFQKITQPDIISFAITHEELVPVDKISVVLQFTSRQVTQEGLITAGDNEFNSFLAQVTAISGTSYQESAAQVSPVGNTGYQYVKTLRIDLNGPVAYPALKRLFDAWPVQVIQTIYTPAQDSTTEELAYSALLEKSKLQGKALAAASGKQLGGVVSIIEAAPQLREGSSSFTTYSPDGTLVMNITKSATFQYSIF